VLYLVKIYTGRMANDIVGYKHSITFKTSWFKLLRSQRKHKLMNSLFRSYNSQTISLVLRLFIFFIIMVFATNIVKSQPFTNMGNLGLDSVFYSSTSWGDFDNDGDRDLILSGEDSHLQAITKVFRNHTDSLTYDSIKFYGLRNSSIAWSDYDNDGDLDLLLTGNYGLNPISKLYRNDDSCFAEETTSLAAVGFSSANWGDYDNDGDLDILLTGTDDGVKRIATVYRNNVQSFNAIPSGLTGVYWSSVASGDYDNDGDLDIFMTGYDGVNRISRIYRNSNGGFTNSQIPLVGVFKSSVAWCDYNNDGYLDAAMTGLDANENPVAIIYRNDSSMGFTDIKAQLIGVHLSSVAWGDYDNDGDPDLLLSGQDKAYRLISRLYRNDNGKFVDSGTKLPGVSFSSMSWCDYDNDDDLDILLTGHQPSPASISAIYRNETTKKNTAPFAPQNIVSIVDTTFVTMRWDKSTDSETPQSGLTYNLKIGTTKGGEEIKTPMAVDSTGWNKLVQSGNVGQSTQWIINNLPPGKYYWCVQAIDAGYKGGLFSEIDSFVVVGKPDIQAHDIKIKDITSNQASLFWKNGNGSNRAVFMYAGDKGLALPKFQTTYPADTVFGKGSQIDISGWYCVYNGEDSTTSVSGLTPNQVYRVMVCEYNGFLQSEYYNKLKAANNPVNFTTPKLEQILTFNIPEIVTYGAAPLILTQYASSGLPITYSIVAGPATVNKNIVTIKGADSIIIKATQVGNRYYFPAPSIQKTLLVNKAALTVTAYNQTRAYMTDNPVLTYNYVGFVNNENITYLETQPVASTYIVKSTPVGTYLGAISVFGGKSKNYDINYVAGNFTIKKAQLTITAQNITRKYGEQNPELVLEYSGFIENDNINVIDQLPTITTTITNLTNAGFYKDAIMVSGGRDSDYDFVYKHGDFTIEKVQLTVTAQHQTKIYGEVIPKLLYKYSGFFGNENESVIKLLPNVSTTVNATSPAGFYDNAITITGGDDENYDFVYLPGDFTVIKALLTVKATNQSKNYGAPNPEVALDYTGFFGSDNQTVLEQLPSISTTIDELTPAGFYNDAITVSGGDDENYDFIYEPSDFTIQKATLTIKPDDRTRNYGEDNPLFNMLFIGFMNDDDSADIDLLPNIVYSVSKGSQAGEYKIDLSGGSDDNYKFKFISGILTVKPVLATLKTTELTDIKTNSATSGGVIIDWGGAEVKCGVCWNTNGSPTIYDARTSDGVNITKFKSLLTGLSPDKQYFVRAYGTNAAGTAYGDEISFTTIATSIESTSDAEITVFPNPSTGTIFLTVPELSKPVNVKVFDMKGKLLYTTTVNSQVNQFDLNLAQGLYFMQVVDDFKVSTFKVIIDEQ